MNFAIANSFFYYFFLHLFCNSFWHGQQMKEDFQIKWQKCLDIIRDNLGEGRTKKLFECSRPISYIDDVLTLEVPSRFFVEKYENELYNILTLSLKKVFGQGVMLDYMLRIIQSDEDSKVTISGSRQSNLVKSKFIQSMQSGAPFRQETEQKPDFDPQLNEALTFENYCVGESNRLPFTIAEYIANNPGKNVFNPFFLYGDVGVGKTHLIQAIGIRIKESNPKAKVFFLSLRQFQQLYADATIHKTINDFLYWFSHLDVLIIDDLQELSHKDGTVNQLFTIFNHLHQNGKALIFSCDRPPMELDGIADRLIDRFKWGITEQLPKPDLALRKQILSFKAKKNGLDLSPEIIDLVATKCNGSVREIEGAVMGILTRSIALNKPITLALAQQVMNNYVSVSKSKAINFDMIVETTADYYQLNPDVIFSKNRQRDIADARQVIMYLSQKLISLSTSTIGHKLNRKHTTVIHGVKSVRERIPFDKELNQAVNAIEEELRK